MCPLYVPYVSLMCPLYVPYVMLSNFASVSVFCRVFSVFVSVSHHHRVAFASIMSHHHTYYVTSSHVSVSLLHRVAFASIMYAYVTSSYTYVTSSSRRVRVYYLPRVFHFRFFLLVFWGNRKIATCTVFVKMACTVCVRLRCLCC